MASHRRAVLDEMLAEPDAAFRTRVVEALQQQVLALDQRQGAQILPIQVEQIEGVEDRRRRSRLR